MSKIDVSQWKEFKVGNFFKITMPKKVPEKSSIQSKPDDEHQFPLINAQTANNGIAGYVKDNGNIINKIPALSIGSRGSMQAFVQEEPFVLGNSCIGLIPKIKMSKQTLLFLATMLFYENYYGKNGYQDYPTKTKLENKNIIKLPVDSAGNPNWQYMDSYIAKRATLAHKCVSELKLTRNDRKSLKISGWQEYKLSDLFEPEFTDGDNKVQNLEQSDDGVNLVGPLNSNNGVLGKFISDTKVFPAGTLTWDMFGKCYEQFEPYQTVSHGHVLVLNPKVKLDEFSLLFVASVLTRLGQNSHFGYNNMLTISKFNKLTIKLPALSDGTPDWATMRKRVVDFQCSVYRTMILLLDLV